MIEQKQKGKTICPGQDDKRPHPERRPYSGGLFNNALRNDRQKAILDGLYAENRRLDALAEQGTPQTVAMVGELKAVNREYIKFLTGNKNSSAQLYVIASQVNNPVMQFLPLGTIPVQFSDMLQFTCKQWPCIYNFTGFQVKPPLKKVSSDEDGPPGFNFTTTLYGDR